MATCVVYDKDTDKPINIIIAEITDQAPEGCYLSELPPNTIWTGSELIIQEVIISTEEIIEEPTEEIIEEPTEEVVEEVDNGR
jgi:hypothetical protein